MHILFLFPYPLDESPSQRFRFEQYLDELGTHGITYSCQSFWDKKNWHILYKPGHSIKKLFGLLVGIYRRVWILNKVSKVDFVFIHRECLPIGPPIIEWLIAKILRKKIIYDFDDAIWLPNTSSENKLIAFIKCPSKVGTICKWSYKVSCGNNYLGEFGRQFNKNVIINPTTVDTEHLHNSSLYKLPDKEGIITIGWTGTHSTLKYLKSLEPIIQQLETQFENFRFLIIADRKPYSDLKSMIFLPWCRETEIEDLLKIDIGVMPLSDDVWSRGKCGFKALQYMALGIPALVSPVGVNTQIIDHAISGFLCYTAEDWFNNLSKLIIDHDLRKRIGIAGQKKVINNYSVSSNSSTYLSLFE